MGKTQQLSVTPKNIAYQESTTAIKKLNLLLNKRKNTLPRIKGVCQELLNPI